MWLKLRGALSKPKVSKKTEQCLQACFQDTKALSKINSMQSPVSKSTEDEQEPWFTECNHLVSGLQEHCWLIIAQNEVFHKWVTLHPIPEMGIFIHQASSKCKYYANIKQAKPWSKTLAEEMAWKYWA